jgi:hypothetical protein
MEMEKGNSKLFTCFYSETVSAKGQLLINVLCSSKGMASVSHCKNFTVLKPQQLGRA